MSAKKNKRLNRAVRSVPAIRTITSSTSTMQMPSLDWSLSNRFRMQPAIKWNERKQSINWVNNTLHTNVRNIDDLRTGEIYCQLFHNIYPMQMPLQRIKHSSDLPYDYVQNFKLLKTAFKLKFINKYIPIDELVGDNRDKQYDFLKWFEEMYKREISREHPFKLTHKKPMPITSSKSYAAVQEIKKILTEAAEEPADNEQATMQQEQPQHQQQPQLDNKKTVRFAFDVKDVVKTWPLSTGGYAVSETENFVDTQNVENTDELPNFKYST